MSKIPDWLRAVIVVVGALSLAAIVVWVFFALLVTAAMRDTLFW